MPEIEALSGGAHEVAARKASYIGASALHAVFPPAQPVQRRRYACLSSTTAPSTSITCWTAATIRPRAATALTSGPTPVRETWSIGPSTLWRCPLRDEAEGSICTGSVFFHAGTYYAFYATRTIGKGEQLSLATGSGRDSLYKDRAQSACSLADREIHATVSAIRTCSAMSEPGCSICSSPPCSRRAIADAWRITSRRT